MKKNTDRQSEDKTAPQFGFRKMRPVKIPKAAWFVLGLSLIMAAVMFALYGLTFKGTDTAGRTLLIYSDGSNIPRVSLRNSLASADFDFEIIEPGKNSTKTDYVYELSKGHRKDKVVVCAVGTNAFRVMDDILESGAENVEGFILIDPEYPGNASLEGYTSDYPDVPCAVFGFDSKAKTSTELSGSQMIFEKLSGVDTMYGHATQRGKIFPSKVFVSHNQMRYLSLSQKSPEYQDYLLHLHSRTSSPNISERHSEKNIHLQGSHFGMPVSYLLYSCQLQHLRSSCSWSRSQYLTRARGN